MQVDEKMSHQPYVERALFIIGDQNTGKSTQLRSIFLDRRLGKQGIIPRSGNLADLYPISNERWLYLRLSSPHEAGEKLEEFLDKCSAKMYKRSDRKLRWNFAGALQPTATPNLAAGPEVIESFVNRFMPERVRVVILSPDRHGSQIDKMLYRSLFQKLYLLKRTEIVLVDATRRSENGLVYADFFDFT